MKDLIIEEIFSEFVYDIIVEIEVIYKYLVFDVYENVKVVLVLKWSGFKLIVLDNVKKYLFEWVLF